MTIPKNITRDHVLEAIEEIDRNGIPKNRKSRVWFLVYNGNRYPVKYVVELANKYANGELLPSSEFTSHEAARYLEKLGLVVEYREKHISDGKNHKYSPLGEYLSKIAKDTVVLRFRDIEYIIGKELPPAARTYKAWWANDKKHPQAVHGWLKAGWRVKHVDLRDEIVWFEKIQKNKRFPPDEFDEKMYSVFEKFATLIEERLKAIVEGRSELEEIYQESEDTIRYMMFHVLTTVGGINPLDVYLEYPHPEVPNRKYAKLDTFVAAKENRPALAFEMKFQKKIGNNAMPKPDNAGAVFADILKLALFRKEQGNIKRYLVYVADEHMVSYLINPARGYEPFISLKENTGFKVTREYLIRKPVTFVRQLKRIIKKEDFPEPTVICRFRRDLKLGNKEMAIRIYEVVP
ncbi:DUF7662 domain-containing protein [Pyrococcus yayanosii]|uniref:Uncharacterized protein n=1 Tax=Pyrococcus yayanosii (strain CH1 / JCM 16557) TaxID=529709 RepID=F8AGI9_PYRYC|nr:hypothetical protein [Pyrococcus yayanosii]AEH25193.1 hypothetical protein PYCH_15270 [Pyrococcus yayanosii CH1]